MVAALDLAEGEDGLHEHGDAVKAAADPVQDLPGFHLCHGAFANRSDSQERAIACRAPCRVLVACSSAIGTPAHWPIFLDIFKGDIGG